MNQQYYIEKVNSIIKVNDTSYHLNEFLSYGGQGGIYQATNKQNGQVVALKWQTSMLAQEEKVVNFYIQEHNQMQHNIRMYDVFRKSKDQIYVIMEYANGGNLFNYLDENRQLPICDKLFIMKQLALGVQELHKLKLIHRDIKPENVVILLDDYGNKTYKICDIGLIKIQSPDFVDEMKVNTGTALFLAPEMIDSTDYDEKVDIWALGVLYWEILFEQPLFDAENETKIYQKIKQFNSEQIREQLQALNIEENKRKLIISMLNPDRQQRIDIHQVVECFASSIKIVIKPWSADHRKEKMNSIQKPTIKINQNQQANESALLRKLQSCLMETEKQIQELEDLHRSSLIGQSQDKIIIDNLQSQLAQLENNIDKKQKQDFWDKINPELKQIFAFINKQISIPHEQSKDLKMPNIQLDESLLEQISQINTSIVEMRRVQENIEIQYRADANQLLCQISKLRDVIDSQEMKFGQDNQDLQVKLDRIKDENGSLLRENAQFRQDNQDLQLELDRIKEENGSLLRENVQFRQNKQDLQLELDRIKDENGSLLRENAQFRQNNQDLQVELDRIKDENGSLLRENAQFRQDNQDLQVELDRIKDENQYEQERKFMKQDRLQVIQSEEYIIQSSDEDRLTSRIQQDIQTQSQAQQENILRQVYNYFKNRTYQLLNERRLLKKKVTDSIRIIIIFIPDICLLIKGVRISLTRYKLFGIFYIIWMMVNRPQLRLWVSKMSILQHIQEYFKKFTKQFQNPKPLQIRDRCFQSILIIPYLVVPSLISFPQMTLIPYILWMMRLIFNPRQTYYNSRARFGRILSGIFLFSGQLFILGLNFSPPDLHWLRQRM